MAYDFIIEINNIISPSIFFYYNDSESFKVLKMNVNFDSDGKIIEVDTVCDQIKNYLKTSGKSCLLLLNLNEFITINRIYPNLSVRKTRRLFDASIKEDFPDLNRYKLYECEYDADGNSLYSIFAIKYDLLDYYKNFLLKCGFRNIAYKSKPHYLINEYIYNYRVNTFALYYYENNLLYFIVCVKGEIVYSVTCHDKIESANRMAISCIDGLNYSLKRNVINTIISNRDGESICDYEVIVKKIDWNFSQEGEKF